ncbi:MAG: endo-1,4-beta-xylanase, partial [Methylocystis sp.]|nr:endo-1,4-beta-xylanase [Methylocystis sp.]
SYVERAFKRAAAVDPKAKLTLNEAQCDNDREGWGLAIRPLLAALVERLLDQGAPVHAIGLQSHLQPQWPSDYAEFARYISRFGEKGLDIYISEFDVNDEAFPNNIAARDEAVADACRRFLKPVLAVPQVKMLVTWQLSDRHSWYRDIARRKRPRPQRLPRPLPFDENFTPKPMRAAMIEAFSR